ncbi:MAG: alpha/beta fold hydrolase [Spirulinaceae cyanobacterium]
MNKFLLSISAFLAIAYVGICVSLLFWQNHLIFFPAQTISFTPKSLGMVYEDIWLEVGEGESLHGWWLPANSETKGVLLYLHGNGGNVSDNLEHARRFQQMGFSVFIFDYRGYGYSEGDFPTEAQVYKDAGIAWDYLVKTRQIEPQNIFLYGHSLGGAIAIDLAVKQPEIAGLIVQGSFTSMKDMSVVRKEYRLFPNFLVHQEFDSMSKIENLKMPVLVIHGTSDGTVPHTMSEELYEALLVPKQLYLVPNAGHNDLATVAGPQYQQKIKEFVELIVSPRSEQDYIF